MPGRAPSYRLRHVLAERFGLEPDQILVGNGSCEPLCCVTKAFGGMGDNLVTAVKTFAVYEWVGGVSGWTKPTVASRAPGLGTYLVSCRRRRHDYGTSAIPIVHPAGCSAPATPEARFMKVRLKILHGTLQDSHGHRDRLEVQVRGPQFVIGSAADCSMCCRSDSVLPHHCEVRLDSHRAIIRPLSEKAGTFLNNQRVEHEQVLQAGDHLRIGRLEFEVLVEQEAPATPAPTDEAPADAAGEELSDLLAQADERERIIRQEHPELRVLHLEAAAKELAEKAALEAAAAEQPPPAKKRGKKKPGKLPTPPPKDEITGDDSTEAAQEALRKMFSRR